MPSEGGIPEWMATATAPNNCAISGCTTNPLPDSRYCGWHNDMRRAVSGPACGQCGNDHWIPYPDASSPHGVCTACRFVYYSPVFDPDDESSIVTQGGQETERI